MLLPSSLDQLRGEINAHAFGRARRCQQISGAATNFEHGCPGGHAEGDQPLDRAVIRGIPGEPALALRRVAIKLSGALLPCLLLALLESTLSPFVAGHSCRHFFSNPPGRRLPSCLRAL